MSFFECVLSVLILSVQVIGTNCACATDECPKSLFNVNLDVSPDKECYAVGETVTLTCSGNIGGPESNECGTGGPFGGWTIPTGTTCEVFTCAKPNTTDTNLNLTPDKTTYDARDKVTYSCSQRFSPVGTTSASCDSQDKWYPATIPMCVASCNLPNIANGGLTSDGPFTDGSTATVECNLGYDLASGSSSSITCQGDGMWSDVPQCYRDCYVTSVAHSDLSYDGAIGHGETKTISCDDRYSYNQQTQLTVMCSNGDLNPTVPAQCFEDCVAATAPVDGGVSGGNRHGQTVTFTCDRGFLLNETDSYTCNDGTWQNGGLFIPTCYSKSLEESITLYCNPDTFIVEIPVELLGGTNIQNSVTMGDCSGTEIDGNYLLVKSSYNDCQTTMKIDNIDEKVYYTNQVTSADAGKVTTEESLNINVECVFDQNNRVSSSAVIQNTISKNLESSGSYNISLAAYTDSGYKNKIDDSVRVDTSEKIYLLAEVNYVTDLDLFGSRCYATPSPKENYHVYYDLVKDGCSSSTYVNDISDSETSKPNFAFALTVFRFTGTEGDSIYVHCDLKVCGNGDCSLSDVDCTSSSSSRRKRSTHISFSKHVSAGPIKMRSLEENDNAPGEGWQINTALTIYSATLSALVLTSLFIVGVLTYRRRSGQTGPRQTGKYSRI